MPNFITEKAINSEIKVLSKKNMNENLKDKIILIENADPGYDWIFGYKISGLITKHGGVNSHMAIRCQELNFLISSVTETIGYKNGSLFFISVIFPCG